MQFEEKKTHGPLLDVLGRIFFMLQDLQVD